VCEGVWCGVCGRGLIMSSVSVRDTARGSSACVCDQVGMVFGGVEVMNSLKTTRSLAGLATPPRLHAALNALLLPALLRPPAPPGDISCLHPMHPLCCVSLPPPPKPSLPLANTLPPPHLRPPPGAPFPQSHCLPPRCLPPCCLPPHCLPLHRRRGCGPTWLFGTRCWAPTGGRAAWTLPTPPGWPCWRRVGGGGSGVGGGDRQKTGVCMCVCVWGGGGG
jgi:hypothetical protein